MHNSGNHHYRPRFPQRIIYLRPIQACRPVYNNQARLDALNAILSGCNRLESQGGIKCSPAFIANVERELMRELSISVYIGQNCTNPTVY